ncbi:MAG: hypothetical protein Q8O00_09690 [Holophaga sp.]|nr:hypothetical protein [Holophaga sp.]
MSDARVRAAIERMEAWLVDPRWEPDPEALAQWDAEFLAAMAQAEKALGWQDLVERGHAAGRLLEARSAGVAKEQDRVRIEIEAQERGNRALRGYGASNR